MEPCARTTLTDDRLDAAFFAAAIGVSWAQSDGDRSIVSQATWRSSQTRPLAVYDTLR